MKKNLFFTVLAALCMCLGFVSCGDDDNTSGQGGDSRDHGDMTFVGTSKFYVVGMEGETSTTTYGDKVELTLVGEGKKQAEIIFPEMTYVYNGREMVVSSFKANTGVEYTMTGTPAEGNMEFDWEEGEFTATTTGADGNPKTIIGRLSAKYSHSAKKFDVVAEFKYGAMPMGIHYEMLEADYQKK